MEDYSSESQINEIVESIKLLSLFTTPESERSDNFELEVHQERCDQIFKVSVAYKLYLDKKLNIDIPMISIYSLLQRDIIGTSASRLRETFVDDFGSEYIDLYVSMFIIGFEILITNHMTTIADILCENLIEIYQDYIIDDIETIYNKEYRKKVLSEIAYSALLAGRKFRDLVKPDSFEEFISEKLFLDDDSNQLNFID